MSHNTEHLYAIKESDGKVVSIFDRENVPTGNSCGCICSKCSEPLQARNNEGNERTYFAHQSDSNCPGESLVHIEAKKVIKKHKYLWLPFLDDPLKKWEFESVLDEKKIIGSPYIADIECKIKSNTFYVEIVVTHDLDESKHDFIETNKIPLLSIYLNEVKDKNALPNDFTNLVLKSAPRKWVYNKNEVLAIKEKEDKEESKFIEQRNKIELAQKKKIWKTKSIINDIKKDQEAFLLKLSKYDYPFDESYAYLNESYKEIYKKNGKNLIYGYLKTVNLKKYGSKYNSNLVVESSSLSKLYGHLAKVHPIIVQYFKVFIGKKIGFKIIYDFGESEFEYDSYRFFPTCDILWMEHKTLEELKEIKVYTLNKLSFEYIDMPR